MSPNVLAFHYKEDVSIHTTQDFRIPGLPNQCSNSGPTPSCPSVYLLMVNWAQPASHILSVQSLVQQGGPSDGQGLSDCLCDTTPGQETDRWVEAVTGLPLWGIFEVPWKAQAFNFFRQLGLQCWANFVQGVLSDRELFCQCFLETPSRKRDAGNNTVSRKIHWRTGQGSYIPLSDTRFDKSWGAKHFSLAFKNKIIIFCFQEKPCGTEIFFKKRILFMKQNSFVDTQCSQRKWGMFSYKGHLTSLAT